MRERVQGRGELGVASWSACGLRGSYQGLGRGTLEGRVPGTRFTGRGIKTLGWACEPGREGCTKNLGRLSCGRLDSRAE